MEGKRVTLHVVEYAETFHYKLNKKAPRRDEKLEAKWSEGSLMGKCWGDGGGHSRDD